MIDRFGRSIDYLRISITDRCNFRCVYCMPESGVTSLSHGDLLTYEEIVRIVRAAAALGIRHLRLTGGEPTVRRGWLELAKMLRDIPGIETLSITTNGQQLCGRIPEVAAAGIGALNVSIDSLDPTVYHSMARAGELAPVLAMLDEALAAGLRVKLNAVPVTGLNEKGLTALAALAKEKPIDVRFIELMPVGCGAALTPVPSQEILRRMTEAFGALEPQSEQRGYGPAAYFRPQGFIGCIGVISPLSHEFCGSCNRVRLTADGFLKLCLNHTAGVDLRALLRGGADDDALREALAESIAQKPRRHGFHEDVADRENRRMNAIGG